MPLKQPTLIQKHITHIMRAPKRAFQLLAKNLLHVIKTVRDLVEDSIDVSWGMESIVDEVQA